jgi:hypothetical protein
MLVEWAYKGDEPVELKMDIGYRQVEMGMKMTR